MQISSLAIENYGNEAIYEPFFFRRNSENAFSTLKISHCKYLHLQYISTTTLEMYASSDSGVRLQDVVHYVSSTSISRSADVLQLEYISSVVLYTVKNISPFGEGKFS